MRIRGRTGYTARCRSARHTPSGCVCSSGSCRTRASQTQVVVHDLDVRLLLVVERGGIDLAEAPLDALVESALRVDSLRTVIVKHLVEVPAVVLVISRLGCR